MKMLKDISFLLSCLFGEGKKENGIYYAEILEGVTPIQSWT